jgi:hypothetical protein
MAAHGGTVVASHCRDTRPKVAASMTVGPYYDAALVPRVM